MKTSKAKRRYTRLHKAEHKTRVKLTASDTCACAKNAQGVLLKCKVTNDHVTQHGLYKAVHKKLASLSNARETLNYITNSSYAQK